MRRTLLMIAAVALLLTQCRKPAVELPTAGPANENMVSMTVTVGHGGKTDITDAGVITWSEGDKLYVGDGSKYIGCLELKSGEGSATGTFSGSVIATSSTTFGFYYLGSGDYTTGPSALAPGTSETATVSFASQTGLIGDLDDCHIGYGTATGKVEGGSVILASTAPVTMTSKVAMAYFDFKDGTVEGYTGAITLSGTNICNEMTVKFSGAESDMFTGKTVGGISLASTPESSKKYVMLVPPATVGEETLNFGNDDMIGSTKFYKGIEANKFYCLGEGEPIAVTVKPIEFTVGMDDDTPRKVKFAPGNLWYGIAAGESTQAFHFETNQWDTEPTTDGHSDTTPWNPSHVSHFKWGEKKYAVSDSENCDGELFCASDFTVADDSHTWRTLSNAEWDYLLNSRDNASSLHDWVTLSDVGVPGLVLLPDGSTATASGITTSEDLATHGAVFLPAAGSRFCPTVYYLGVAGCYWSSTSDGSDNAYWVDFEQGEPVYIYSYYRNRGYSVRLVRDIPNASVNGSANDFNGDTW